MGDEPRQRKQPGQQEVDDQNVAIDRSLADASESLAAARALISLRKTVGRNLRVAIRCLLEAQEKIEIEGPSSAARLDLLEAIRLVGSVEHELKEHGDEARSDFRLETPEERNRRAFERLPAHLQIELEPERRTSRSELAPLPLNGVTVNVSRGGLLAKIDQGILRHGRYLVRFLEAGSAVKPAITHGSVRRSRARNHGWEVGIEFDDPLESLK
jgi:hypothetical protein